MVAASDVLLLPDIVKESYRVNTSCPLHISPTNSTWPLPSIYTSSILRPILREELRIFHTRNNSHDDKVHIYQPRRGIHPPGRIRC
jgi:hypothetical protein